MKNLREKMVQTQLKSRDITDSRVLEAMGEVPREEFIPEEMAGMAYRDGPLPIGEEQTISQPYIVALMIQALEVSEQDTVLEIGTGSGYAAAVLSRIAGRVYSVERHLKLGEAAIERFNRLGYDNIFVKIGDGTLGWEEHAPYDAIVVTAGSPEIPVSYVEQMKIGGRLVIPVGRMRDMQELVRARKVSEGEITEEPITGVRFVPLVGAAGWQAR